MTEQILITSTAAILGQTLALLRRWCELRQSDVAEHLGVTPSTWCRIEKGETDMTVTQLRRAIKLLSTTEVGLFETVSVGEHMAFKRGLHVLPTSGSAAALTNTFMRERNNDPIVRATVKPVVGRPLGVYLWKRPRPDAAAA